MNHKVTLLEDDDYDLDDDGPAEIDFSKVRLIRRGLPPSHPLANSISLDPEIIQFFKTPEAINDALRRVMNEMRHAA
jgi:hypothetical protein